MSSSDQEIPTQLFHVLGFATDITLHDQLKLLSSRTILSIIKSLGYEFYTNILS